MVNFIFNENKIIGVGCILFTVPIDSDHWAIDAIKSYRPIIETVKSIDMQIFLVACYEFMKSKLTGDQNKIKKSKIINMDCGGGDGYFSVKICCAPSIAAIRKSITTFLKFFHNTPKTLYDKYCRLIGSVPDVDAYNQCYDVVLSAMSKSTVLISGKIVEQKMKELTKAIMSKIQLPTGAKKTFKGKDFNPNNSIEMQINKHKFPNAQSAIFAFSYLQSTGINSQLVGNTLYFMNLNAPIRKSEKIETFIEKSMGDISTSIIHQGIDLLMDAEELGKINNITKASIKTELLKAFKE